ncbi:hypothetical protein [uncultured Bacteroides sp.]|jgi:hypothetical protein|uniref:hypothetical protein n=1 Tax=uncultured Bacteroides sp. TaxID=162156 RepID=UPI00260175FA|nr:hypothetical protein [uncultured Bacteroides sp.]
MADNNNQIIRFDWAMKRLLRNKANFSVLEGLLTTLLNEKIVIQSLLESESNQEDEYDKYNRVDMLAARERLKLDSMFKDELAAYYRHLDSIVILRTNIYTERAEGHAEGRAEGLEEGLHKGLIKGREEEKRENARNLKGLRVTSDIISQATGLTKEEIDRL